MGAAPILIPLSCVVACLLVGPAAAVVQSLSLSSPNASQPQPLSAAACIFLQWSALVTDTSNATRLVVYPYVNGVQWGAEAAVLRQDTGVSCGANICISGEFVLPLPVAHFGNLTIFITAQPAPQGPTVGTPPPPTSLQSNIVSVSVNRAVGKRRTPRNPDSPTVGVYFETWFTPLNFFWQGGTESAEAIPLVGRYHSFDVDVMRQQAYWFARAGVDVIPADWTNNLWSTPSWAARAANIQEIVNATSLLYGVFADLNHNEGWDTPQQLLLLGLDNGPVAPLPAVMEEIDFILSAYIANASVGPDQWVNYLGKPLIVIFDGTGANHSDITHPNFTIRWMASQDQDSHFNLNGYWSWMDGTVNPPITPYAGSNEAVTLAPAFFADGGWLASSALGHQGGATMMAEFSNAVQAAGTVSGTSGGASSDAGTDGSAAGTTPLTPDIRFVFMSQWAEYAGQANGQGYGPNKDIYVDSYSAELSNEMEPTGTTACAYRRPGVACGGWGMRYLNILSMMSDAVADLTALDTRVVALSIVTPGLGEVSNYTDTTNTSVVVAWSIASFNSTSVAAGGPYILPVALPVEISIDSVVVGRAPAGQTSASINVTGIDPRYVHSVSVRALPPNPTSTAHLTRYPLSRDVYDEGAPLPLPQCVAAQGVTALHLPESLW